jgi:prevent-host-death family protein
MNSMPKATFTTSDLSRKSGDIIAEAMRGPVTITQRNKPRLVLMNIEDFQLLRAHGDTRQVYRTEDMPEEHLAMFAEALEEYRSQSDD